MAATTCVPLLLWPPPGSPLGRPSSPLNAGMRSGRCIGTFSLRPGWIEEAMGAMWASVQLGSSGCSSTDIRTRGGQRGRRLRLDSSRGPSSELLRRRRRGRQTWQRRLQAALKRWASFQWMAWCSPRCGSAAVHCWLRCHS